MREILFRAKRLYTNEWVEGYLIKGKWYLGEEINAIVPLDVVFYPHSEISEYIEIDPTTVCQFTGSTDKNGNKVFEGDIVEFLHKEQRDIRSVIWYDEFMSYELATNGRVDMHDGWDFTDCCFRGVVVGNIFDNKELLQ